MSETIKFQCHIKISSKYLDELVGQTLSFMGDSKTIDENGKVVFDCALKAEDKNKSFPISIDSEEYTLIGTGKCNAIAHREYTNPYCATIDQSANIKNIRIYKEIDKADSDQKEQIDIYTAQVEKIENTNDSQATSQDNQNLITLEADLTYGILTKDIHWVYYIKYRNEPLWDQITIKNLKFLPIEKSERNATRVSFDINVKFQYTIKEDGTQKEVEDYLKENQQLIIFAYKNAPAYQTSNGQTHTTLNITTLPILKIKSNTLTILYTHTNTTYTLTHPCDTHHLSENLKSEKTYTLELRDSNLYIKDKENNKDIALVLTKEIPNIQEKTILLDSKDSQALQTTLGLYTHRDRVDVYVEVELSKWDRLKRAYQTINELSVSERYKLVGGEPLKMYGPDNIHTANTCAMQISYILNKNGIFLENYISKKVTEQPIGIKDDFVLIGADNHNYVVRVSTMIKLLKLGNLLGNADKSYNPKTMNTKAENQNFFYNELLTSNKNGLAAMEISGWNNARGHVTLWDSDEKRFLDNSNYLLDERDNVIVRQFYFWEIE